MRPTPSALHRRALHPPPHRPTLRPRSAPCPLFLHCRRFHTSPLHPRNGTHARRPRNGTRARARARARTHTPLCTPRRILRLTVLGRSPRLGALLSPRACCEWVDGAGADYKEHRGLVLGGLGLGVRLLPDLRPTRCCAGGVGVGAREAHLSENVANYSVNQ